MKIFLCAHQVLSYELMRVCVWIYYKNGALEHTYIEVCWAHRRKERALHQLKNIRLIKTKDYLLWSKESIVRFKNIQKMVSRGVSKACVLTVPFGVDISKPLKKDKIVPLPPNCFN